MPPVSLCPRCGRPSPAGNSFCGSCGSSLARPSDAGGNGWKLFLGVFALFAWQQRTPPRRLALYLAIGLAGIHVANVVRLTMLGYVGYQWGAQALQSFHQHAGWVLFLVWMVAFWALVLRRFEGRADPVEA